MPVSTTATAHSRQLWQFRGGFDGRFEGFRRKIRLNDPPGKGTAGLLSGQEVAQAAQKESVTLKTT